MLHFTCDLCGKPMSATGDRRYVVKIEVFAAHDPAELTEADLDDDHLDEVSQLLEEMGDEPDAELPPAAQKLQYDLCPNCHKKFVRDPLSKEAAQKFDFSEN
jgi:hypothetical protein